MVLFAHVLQLGSFSEAARRTGVPVSSLSRKISGLERQLGVRLLERTTRSLNATETGREFFLHCQRLMEAVEGAQASLQQRKAEISGTLRLAAPPSLSEVILAPLIQSFIAQYPKVSVKVLVTDRHIEMVEDEVDVSLRVGRQAESSLIFRRLTSYRHILVAAPAYLASAGRPKHPADLGRHRLLGFTKWFGDVRWKLSNGTEVQQSTLQLSLGMNDYAGILRAAVAGMGVAEIPSILCRKELREGRLVAVMPAWRFDEVDLSAYYLTRRHPSRMVELFLDHCSSQLQAILQDPPSAPRDTGAKPRKSNKR
jgi:DNA-binding transcriptional LysR family regulator